MAHTYYSKTNTFSFNLYDIRVINDRFCVCLQKKPFIVFSVRKYIRDCVNLLQNIV